MTFHVIQFITLFLLMLVTGVFWGPWLSLHRSMENFSEEFFIQIVKTMGRNLAAPMRLLMPGCIFFLVLSSWFYPQIPSSGFYFSLASLVLSIIALLVTILTEVPIVGQIMGWTVSNIPPDWQTIRDRWRFFHVIRVFASLASFGCFLISILLPGK